MRIVPSNILSCFDEQTIGTKVSNREAFMQILETAACAHDFDAEDTEAGVVKGQGFVSLPEEAISTVAAGVGKHTHDPADYVLRLHRGAVSMFLKRDKAETASGVAAIVYTREAYLADPDVQSDGEEATRISESDCTHVLVAVLAFAGPKAPLGFARFVKNLAGGNNAYQPGATTHEALVDEAKRIVEYQQTWCTVAD